MNKRERGRHQIKMEPQKFSSVQYFIKSNNTCKRGPVLKMHHFKILWIDQNKGVNHINFLIFMKIFYKP